MNKLLKMVPLFVALALTACGGGKGGEEEQSQQQSSGQPASKSNSSTHKHSAAENAPYKYDDTNHWQECEAGDGGQVRKGSHKWVADETKTADNKAATCKEAGWEYQVCSTCGATRKHDLAKTEEHTYGTWVNDENAKCGEAGSRSRTCSVCDHVDTETLGIIPHDWDLEHAVTVPASNGGVEYTTAVCTKCGATGYFVAAAKATLSENASKKSAPEGCIKMSPDGAYMTVAFNLDTAAEGVFWLRGAMDYWYEDSNNNQNKTYYSQNNGHTNESEKKGNFKLEVGPADNLAEVELPENTKLKFGDMLPETVGSVDSSNHNWSVIGDCIVGAASLAAGLNTIKFTRVDSYNLAIHDFLFVVPAPVLA